MRSFVKKLYDVITNYHKTSYYIKFYNVLNLHDLVAWYGSLSKACQMLYHRYVFAHALWRSNNSAGLYDNAYLLDIYN